MILLSTNLTDEADILAGNCHFYLSLTVKNLGDIDSQGKIPALFPSVIAQESGGRLPSSPIADFLTSSACAGL